MNWHGANGAGGNEAWDEKFSSIIHARFLPLINVYRGLCFASAFFSYFERRTLFLLRGYFTLLMVWLVLRFKIPRAGVDQGFGFSKWGSLHVFFLIIPTAGNRDGIR